MNWFPWLNRGKAVRPPEQFFSWREVLPSQTPGTGTLAYQSLDLPLQTPIGPATYARQQVRLFAPMIYDPNQLVPIAGLGGLATGQAMMTPLANPDMSI